MTWCMQSQFIHAAYNCHFLASGPSSPSMKKNQGSFVLFTRLTLIFILSKQTLRYKLYSSAKNKSPKTFKKFSCCEWEEKRLRDKSGSYNHRNVLMKLSNNSFEDTF